MENANDAFYRLESKVDKLAEALNELIILNERQIVMQERIAKLEEADSRHSNRIIEIDQKLNKWINMGVGGWGVVMVIYTIAHNFIH